MYNWDSATRPSVVGKYDEAGEWILPSTNELTPATIARVIAKRLARFHESETIRQQLAFMEAKERELALPRANFPRVRSEEHTSELQSLMRISYAVFCLTKKKNKTYNHQIQIITILRTYTHERTIQIKHKYE